MNILFLYSSLLFYPNLLVLNTLRLIHCIVIRTRCPLQIFHKSLPALNLGRNLRAGFDVSPLLPSTYAIIYDLEIEEAAPFSRDGLPRSTPRKDQIALANSTAVFRAFTLSTPFWPNQRESRRLLTVRPLL